MNLNRTKILATVGPACDTAEKLQSLNEKGVSCFRINMSHGTQDDKRNYIQTLKKVKITNGDRPTLLADLAGPKIRVNAIFDTINVKEGEHLFISNENFDGENVVPISSGFQFGDIHNGAKVLINDGRIQLTIIEKISNGTLKCEVLIGGEIQSRKGVNFPGIELDIPSLTDQDKKDIDLALEEGVDWIALSFVRSAIDADVIKKYLMEKKSNTPIMAKVEKWEAVKDLTHIIRKFDAVMVARGDLGVEVPLEKVPAIQKEVIQKAKHQGKPVIIATQMLESMVESPVPTRAEVSDIANAILDGADGLLVTGETAAGNNPEAVIDVLKKVIEETENTISFEIYDYEPRQDYFSTAHSISHAACKVAKEISVESIVTMTHSGSTARMISRYRPEAKIIALTPNKNCYRQLKLVWGITPILIDKYDNADQIQGIATKVLDKLRLVKPNDRFVITGGVPVGVSGTTNYLSVIKRQ